MLHCRSTHLHFKLLLLPLVNLRRLAFHLLLLIRQLGNLISFHQLLQFTALYYFKLLYYFKRSATVKWAVAGGVGGVRVV